MVSCGSAQPAWGYRAGDIESPSAAVHESGMLLVFLLQIIQMLYQRQPWPAHPQWT
jgi:hypothetical protein